MAPTRGRQSHVEVVASESDDEPQSQERIMVEKASALLASVSIKYLSISKVSSKSSCVAQ
jgi:hypothetical protein